MNQHKPSITPLDRVMFRSMGTIVDVDEETATVTMKLNDYGEEVMRESKRFEGWMNDRVVRAWSAGK